MSDNSHSSSDDDDGSGAIIVNKNNNRRIIKNAFAGFDPDSSDDEVEDDKKSANGIALKPPSSDDESVEEEEEELDAADKGQLDEEQEASDLGEAADEDSDAAVSNKGDEILEFRDLTGRCTRNGSVIQSDLVDAIQQHVVGAGGVHSRPTEIQCECWTTMLSEPTRDRDVVAISKTGSGKTLAFLVPLLCGVMSNSDTDDDQQLPDSGAFIFPRAIVLAPTRVLAQQIFQVASSLVESTLSLNKVKLSLVLGGSGYHHQVTDLLATRPDLIVATPGRLNSLCGRTAAGEGDDQQQQDVEMCIQLNQVCELVIDEADMMLALGFEDDLSWFSQLVNAKSANGFRLVLTSATWEKQTSASLSKFRAISEHEPVFLVADGAGQIVTKNVTQTVHVLAHKGAPRLKALVALLFPALKQDKNARMIVFCLHKAEARQIGKELQAKGIPNVVLEGDMSQSARAAAIKAFRSGSQGRVLIATDVASRGLDVLSVSHVFNYSLGLSMEGYIHRCGRTGRAGRFGVAHTFVVKGDEKFAPELCTVLRQANQVVPDDLRIMAAKELKRRQRKTNDVATGGDDGGDSDDLEEMRQDNRAKQIRKNQERTKKGNFNRR